MRSIFKLLLLFGLCVYNVSSFASFAPIAPNGTYAGYPIFQDWCNSLAATGSVTGIGQYRSGGGSLALCVAWPSGAVLGKADPNAPYCPANATMTGGSCDCDSGFSENAAHTACEVRAATPTSPNGPTAPRGAGGPLGPAPIFLAGSTALGMLGLIGLGSGVGTFPTLLLGAGAFASGLIAAPGWFGGFSSPVSPQSALDQAGIPITVNLATDQPSGGDTSGSTAGVGQNAAGQFVPAGGGTFSGNGATGGWSTGGATGEWTYTPPAVPNQPAPTPIIAIRDGGYTMQSISYTDSSGATTAGVVANVYADGSLMVTESRTVPVVTDGGTATTAGVSVSTSYTAQGTLIPGSTVATTGTTFGNGSPVGTSSGVVGGSGNGTAGSGTTAIVGDGFAMTGAGSGYSGAKGGTGVGQGCGTGVPCKVAVEETGTPTAFASDKFKSLADAWKDQGQANLDTIAGRGDKGFFLGWDVMFQAPAISSCTPFVLPRDMGAIDPCGVVDGVRYIVGLMWAVGGLFMSLKMIREVV